MPIVCPHCTTSYAVDPATLGASGRMVRCARCKETWLALPEAARTPAAAFAGPVAQAPAEAAHGAEAEWGEAEPPVVDSPSISADLPDDEPAQAESFAEDRQLAPDDAPMPPRFGRRAPARRSWLRMPSLRPARREPHLRKQRWLTLPVASLAMASLAAALLIWRVDIVRLMPQTADFYSRIGLGVNLRGLAIKDVKVSSETAEGKPVLVIEGMILDVAGRAVEVPRLRFSVRDERGTEIYAWNAVLEQSVLQPGEKAWFRSRLAAPPAEARSIDVRFFNRRDLAAGRA